MKKIIDCLIPNEKVKAHYDSLSKEDRAYVDKYLDKLNLNRRREMHFLHKNAHRKFKKYSSIGNKYWNRAIKRMNRTFRG